ncbi:MAG: hypothetical protein ACFFDK_00235 [Promethearchaeota archaeon]
MTIQYYDLLQDKSKKRLFYLAGSIAPQFTIGELKILLEDIAKKSKSSKSNDLVTIGNDYDTTADLSKLSEKELQNLYQIFISREINDKLAVKWRFYQFLKYIRDIILEEIKINLTSDIEDSVDLIVKLDGNSYIFILCYDVLDSQKYSKAIEVIIKTAKSSKIIPDRVIFASNKTYRDIPLGGTITIDKKELIPELWLEVNDENAPFDSEDLLIVNNTDLSLAGFNFTSMEDLLDYVYEFSEGGQISIFRQPDFFSEHSKEESEKELIWKGIMIKNDI